MRYTPARRMYATEEGININYRLAFRSFARVRICVGAIFRESRPSVRHDPTHLSPLPL